MNTITINTHSLINKLIVAIVAMGYGVDESDARTWLLRETNFQYLSTAWVNSGYKNSLEPVILNKTEDGILSLEMSILGKNERTVYVHSNQGGHPISIREGSKVELEALEFGGVYLKDGLIITRRSGELDIERQYCVLDKLENVRKYTSSAQDVAGLVGKDFEDVKQDIYNVADLGEPLSISQYQVTMIGQ